MGEYITMKNIITYKAKFLPPTTYKGARITITNNVTEKRKIIPYNYKYNSIKEGAIDHIKETENKKVIFTFWDKQTMYLLIQL